MPAPHVPPSATPPVLAAPPRPATEKARTAPSRVLALQVAGARRPSGGWRLDAARRPAAGTLLPGGGLAWRSGGCAAREAPCARGHAAV